MNVVLTGFMGTGKSTVGRLLAEVLGYEFVDTDDLIVSRHGPIDQIFATAGEPAFRAIEGEVAAELAQRTGLVIGTGGGLMVARANADALERTGHVFTLVASPETIITRVASDEAGVDRPLLAGDDVAGRIRSLLDERSAAYGRFRQVVTDDRSAAEIAAELAQLVHLEG